VLKGARKIFVEVEIQTDKIDKERSLNAGQYSKEKTKNRKN